MLEDTPPEMQARYLDRLRALGPVGRLALLCRLNADGRALAFAGLRARHPAAPESELRVRLAALLYGREAASLLGPVPADAAEPRDVRLP